MPNRDGCKRWWAMPASYITARAKHLIDLDALNNEQKEAFGIRFEHLMETPADRDVDIMRDAVGYLAARYGDETGDPDDAEKYAADLASFIIQPFSEISEIPLPVRGVLHSTGAALVSSVCARQAWLGLVGIGALEIGDDMGKQTKAAAKRMSTPQKKQMQAEGGLKKTIAQLSAVDKSDTIEE